MKRAVILHALEQTSAGHWYPWLKDRLEDRGYEVWMPDMPNNTKPSAQATTAWLLERGWDFTDNLLIGHSWGAVQSMHLLQHMPEDQKVNTAVLLSAFTDAILTKEDWAREQLGGLFEEPYDYKRIKSKAEQILVVHGDDDPWCEPSNAQWIAKQLDCGYVPVPGGGHFSTSLNPKYSEFPELLEILEERSML